MEAGTARDVPHRGGASVSEVVVARKFAAGRGYEAVQGPLRNPLAALSSVSGFEGPYGTCPPADAMGRSFSGFPRDG
jgi:hypothetical protein